MNANDYEREYKIHNSWKLYEAFGEEKTLPQWAKDPRCKVRDVTLRDRLRRGFSFEKALSFDFCRIGQKIYYGFGENKTLMDWSRDSRCKVCYSILQKRLNKEFSLKMALEKHCGERKKSIRSIKSLELYGAFGENKTFRDWTKDLRCVDRIKKSVISKTEKGFTFQEAIMTPNIDSSAYIVVNYIFRNPHKLSKIDLVSLLSHHSKIKIGLKYINDLLTSEHHKGTRRVYREAGCKIYDYQD